MASLSVFARSGFALILCLCALFPVQAMSDPLRLNVRFETDERHFTILAWLNWIADRSPQEEQDTGFPEQDTLRAHLKKLHNSLYQKHRKAYNKYLKGSALYVKNGLLIKDSLYYDMPPHFTLHNQPQDLQDAATAYRVNQLPSPELLQEFYREANLENLWKTTFQPAHLSLSTRFEARGKKMLQDTLYFLKMPQTHVVSIRFNLLGSFGIAGQTSFSPWEKRYLIKIHPSPKINAKEKWTREFYEEDTLQTLRHEFGHALLNGAAKKHAPLMRDAIQRFAETTEPSWYNGSSPESYVPEMLAQCLGYLDIEPEIHENVFYYNENILFLHFIEQLDAYKKTGRPFDQFLPTLFSSFNGEKEAKRWQAMKAQKKAAGETE